MTGAGSSPIAHPAIASAEMTISTSLGTSWGPTLAERWIMKSGVATFMQNIGRVYEETKVQAQDLVEKMRQLIHEGSVRRVIIKDDHGAIFMEVPLGVAAVGVILSPVLAAV